MYCSRLCASLLLTATAANAQTAKPAAGAATAKAIFAGGCFWCMETAVRRAAGRGLHDVGIHRRQEEKSDVRGSVRGRHRPCRGRAGRLRSEEGQYEKLLDVFWHNIDPRSKTSSSAITARNTAAGSFMYDDEQKRLAEASKTRARPKQAVQGCHRHRNRARERVLSRRGLSPGLLSSRIRCATSIYRSGCGRDARLKQLWGKAPE